MKNVFVGIFSFLLLSPVVAQKTLTPEMLLEVGKVSPVAVSKDGKTVYYSVRNYDVATAKSTTKKYQMPLAGGNAMEIKSFDGLTKDKNISSDGKYSISSNDVKVKNVFGTDFYPDLKNSNVQIYDNLNYRHWDTWEDGKFGHVFLNTLKDGKVVDSLDLMPNEAYDCPQKPFGGDEDYIWSPDGKNILYVTKKKYGKDYAVSTNTDIYAYNIDSKTTSNLTEGMMGYDINPSYSAAGALAWLSMKTDGYESDKNDLVVLDAGVKMNLTQAWDGTVDSYKWAKDGKKIYFVAAQDGTMQLFEVDYPGKSKKMPVVKQLTNGDFDIHGIFEQVGNTMIVERTDMNHAVELYTVDLKTGGMKQLTHVNDAFYASLNLPKFQRRYLKSADGASLMVWVIYPPQFDSTKKYPTLLYCQGGPQSPLTQFYSFRWNFSLMASEGYIVVAPNRHGMPGHGVKWNEEISGDYGGLNMQDYLIAIDELSKEPYVDKDRRGCVGASYGGYSVYYLAGIHEKRFKTFIAHDGIFDWKSMYGTTEEMFFVNHDLGGPYWDEANATAQKSYNQFNPANFVKKWDSPILIIQGGRDYRVPIGQGFGAFQAAQLQGIKSKILFFPNENHWVLNDENALIWQHEFYKWLSETLK